MPVNQTFFRFVRNSGFKVLAMARLTSCEYSIVLYLINCESSGLDQLVTTEAELASLIGRERRELRDGLTNLKQRNIVKLHYGEVTHTPERDSFGLAFQFDFTRWILDFEPDVTAHDAIVFPFRRHGVAKLQVFEGQKRDVSPNDTTPTWRRVLDSFLAGRSLDDSDLERAEEDSRILVETHPVDQVLLMIRHFGLRIPTLSLLASAWQHYQGLFESETQKVDMLEARQKHVEFDNVVRRDAQDLLDRHEDLELSEEEVTVLQILTKHQHPRRQLFWAYQLRSRYPKLEKFFEEHASLMLSVTTSGIVRRRPNQD